MNFSKLKLTEMLAQGAGTGLSTSANNKASQAAQASKQVSSTTNSIGAQTSQMSAKPTKANVASPVQQRTQAAPSPVATKTGPQTVVSSVDYFNMLRTRKEYVKQLAEKTSDWKQELTEKLGVDDEVFHPYVEVMPHGDFKLKDAQKKALIAAKKEKEEGKLMGEQARGDRDMTTIEKIDRRNKRDEDEDFNADARRKFRQLALRGKKKGKAMGHRLGEEVLDEAKKPKKDDKKKESKTDPRQEKAGKKLPKRGAKVSAKTKRAAAELDKINRKSQATAKDAKNNFKKAHEYHKKGDEVNALKHHTAGRKAAGESKSLRAQAMKYVPVGSTTYSNPNDPGRMNNKFKSAMSTSKGREDIVARTFNEGKRDELDDLLDAVNPDRKTPREERERKERDRMTPRGERERKERDRKNDAALRAKARGGGGERPNQQIVLGSRYGRDANMRSRY